MFFQHLETGGINLFSERQKEILSYLIESNEEVTAKWIAKQLGLSDRTIRNEIQYMKADCDSVGVSIESIRGKGYVVHITDRELFESSFNKIVKVKDNTRTVNFSYKKNRIEYLIRRLILERDCIKIEDLADELFVSQSTMQNDLKAVKDILSEYSLKLVNRPYYGTYVEGHEYMKRVCLSSFMLGNDGVLNIDTAAFELYENIRDVIIKKVNKYNVEISDLSLCNLTIHIMIACKRIEKDLIIEDLNDYLVVEYPMERKMAAEIVKEVEEHTGLVFPNSEVDYIIIHLLGTKLLYKETLIEYRGFNDAKSIVQCMVNRLKRELNWDLKDDNEFMQALTLHIRSAINRLKYNMNIRNPLLDEIKTKYPDAFDGAVIANKCIEDYLSVEVGEHEIAYIAIHIAAALERMKLKRKEPKRVVIVCASGVGSAKLLYYHLKKLFEHNLQVVDSINYYELSKYDLSTIDFVISTIPIKEDLGVPVQVVNTFLGEDDIVNIKNRLFLGEQDRISPFLHPSRVFVHMEFDNKETVLEFMCNELYKQGIVPENYLNLVLERESVAATCFGNLVAIPHPIKLVTEETFWTVCTLKYPILWDDNQMVQFICLLNIQKDKKEDLNSMYTKLISVVEDKTVVQKLINSNSVDEIINILI